jgi:hypothetical protein
MRQLREYVWRRRFCSAYRDIRGSSSAARRLEHSPPSSFHINKEVITGIPFCRYHYLQCVRCQKEFLIEKLNKKHLDHGIRWYHYTVTETRRARSHRLNPEEIDLTDGINIKFSLIGKGNENSNLELVRSKESQEIRPSVRPSRDGNVPRECRGRTTREQRRRICPILHGIVFASVCPLRTLC